MLFNEPKLLKSRRSPARREDLGGFSARQRAEIAEIEIVPLAARDIECFSALQRAEIAEIEVEDQETVENVGFSALQRAEIAEMRSSFVWLSRW